MTGSTSQIYRDQPNESLVVGSNHTCPDKLVRTFDVSDSFTIADLDVGLLMGHDNRNDVLPRSVLIYLRGHDFEREVFADHRLIELMDQHDISGDYIYAEAFREDTARIQLLTALATHLRRDSKAILFFAQRGMTSGRVSRLKWVAGLNFWGRFSVSVATPFSVLRHKIGSLTLATYGGKYYLTATANGF